MKYIIKNGIIVNEGQQFVGSLVVTDGVITDIIPGILDDSKFPDTPSYNCGKSLPCPDTGKGSGLGATFYILPGIIDSHVHFREPGLTHKADIESESRAAAYGGVTSYFEMPNTNPQATSLETLEEKFALAREKSHVNYSFFPGATNDNIEELAKLDYTRFPGIKLFMGSSTGNMLVDKYGSLLKIFKTAADLGVVLMAHCEDTEIINQNMEKIKKQMGDDPDVLFYPLIRSEEACLESSCLAANLARQFGTHLHIAHISTEAELNAIFPEGDSPLSHEGERGRGREATAEATIAHLMFSNADYSILRTLIKCNPAVKKDTDRDALRRGLMNGQITTIGTDHAPHTLAEKQGGAAKAMSGMPMIQFSLVTMLSLVDEGILTMEQLVALMSHNPATLFSVKDRGFIRKGYKADLTIVRKGEPWTVTEDVIQSKCKWSPMTGRTYNWHIVDTICNGEFVLKNGNEFNPNYRGEEIRFNRINKLTN